MSNERLYLITYDIRDPKRLRRIFRLMKGYGEWLQYSVFQCLLSRKRHVELIAELDDAIEHGEDHILCFELSPAGRPSPKITSLGKSYEPVERKPIIV